MSQRPDDHRRKWDRSQYERLAQDRIRGQKGEKEDEDGKLCFCSGQQNDSSTLRSIQILKIGQPIYQLQFRENSSSVGTTKLIWTANLAKVW